MLFQPVSHLVPATRGAQPGEASGMTTQPSLYSRHRFTAEIISHAV
jgi:hypothetical protein